MVSALIKKPDKSNDHSRDKALLCHDDSKKSCEHPPVSRLTSFKDGIDCVMTCSSESEQPASH